MNKEFIKLKNRLSIKAILKIILYTCISFLIFTLIICLINKPVANFLYNRDISLYYLILENKNLILLLTYILIFLIILFYTIRNTMNCIAEIMKATDAILKNPEEEIKLPTDLVLIENKLNKIRIDLISNQNIAKEAEQKKNDLIVYMAHDLKTPLTSVIGYLTLLTEEKEISKELREKYLGIVLKKSLRVEELINQFFDITRYNLQKMPITKQKINIAFLIEQLVEECYPMLEDKKLQCIVTKPNIVLYMGDGDKLARAFENLLKNAINYSIENTKIEINIEENEKEINVIFKNKTEKIPEYKLEKLFDKFYRGDEARGTKTGGSGLGLAITKQIIELHGGNISVKNNDDYIEFYINLKK